MVRVVIIGAGVSGLSAAMELLEAGLDDLELTILEASSAPGGRVKTIVRDGQLLELGANWIHGTEKNPFYDFALQQGVIDDDSLESENNAWALEKNEADAWLADGPGTLNIFHSTTFDQAQVLDLAKAISQFYVDTTDDSAITDPCYTSYGDFLNQSFQKKFLSKQDPKLLELSRSIWDYMITSDCISNGSATPYDVDNLSHEDHESLDGNPYFLVEKGMQRIVDKMVGKIPSENLQLNTAVSAVRVHSSDPCGQSTFVEVVCANGEVIEADHVIITVSLGVLKAWCKDDVFQPPLPEKKMSAISRMGYGLVGKLIFRFKSTPPSVIDDHGTVAFFKPPVEGSVSGNWLKDLGYIRLSRLHSDWWIGFVFGKGAEEVEKGNLDELKHQLHSHLAKLTRCPDLPPLQDLLVTSWGSNPYTRGSYSYIKTGSSTADIKTLAEPVGSIDNPLQLMFAGEATHPHFFSTVHGAFLTGRDVVRRLVEYIR